MVVFTEKGVGRIQRQKEVVVDLHVRKRKVLPRKLPSEFRVRDPRLRKQTFAGRIPPKIGIPSLGRGMFGFHYSWSDFIGELASVPTLEDIMYRYEVPGLDSYDMKIGLPDILTRSEKEPLTEINLLDELITMEDLDFGYYQSMIFPDRDDRTKVKGYIYLRNLVGVHCGDRRSRTVFGIRDALKTYTGILPRIGPVTNMSNIQSGDPFYFIRHTGSIELVQSEIEGLTRSFENGGFVVFSTAGVFDTRFLNFREINIQDYTDLVDKELPKKIEFYNSLRKALGNNYQFYALRNTHFVYHSFFDFDCFPGDGEALDWQKSPFSYKVEILRKSMDGEGSITAVDGIFSGKRLVGVFLWNEMGGHFPSGSGASLYHDKVYSGYRAFVNIVVAAMLQKGSLSRRNTADFATFRRLSY